MKTLFLLVLLTQNAAGDINASFVNTETLEQCQQKIQMLEAVFTGSDIPVLESRCINSDLTFSAFEHAASSGMRRHFYLLDFSHEAVAVSLMQNWRDCSQQAKPGDRKYCASSVQSLLE